MQSTIKRIATAGLAGLALAAGTGSVAHADATRAPQRDDASAGPQCYKDWSVTICYTTVLGTNYQCVQVTGGQWVCQRI